MSQTEEHRLYGLIELAETQQAAVQTALQGLAAERAALQRERERGRFGIRVKSGHKPRRGTSSSKVYLFGRTNALDTPLKIQGIADPYGLPFSGH